MSLKDKLQIYLITYNRKEKLQKTLDVILGENSPVRDFDITILDNASNDGTSELIEEYCTKFLNIKHIKHPVNIGGNANICRAFEMAASCNKEYAWILCDDDTIRFRHFQDIENAIMSGKYDCILVERKINFNAEDYPYIINTLAFVSAGIYKTKNINSTVLFNAYANIMYSFPHLALGCHLLNIGAKFYIPKFRIIKQGLNLDLVKCQKSKKKTKKKHVKSDYSRGTNREIHFRLGKRVNLFSGMINSYQMIRDKNLRKKCCDTLCIGKPFLYSSRIFLLTNGLNLYNICDYFLGISLLQKIQFIIAAIIAPINYIIKFERRPRGIYVNILGLLKTKIIPITKKLYFD